MGVSVYPTTPTKNINKTQNGVVGGGLYPTTPTQKNRKIPQNNKRKEGKQKYRGKGKVNRRSIIK